MKCPKCHADNTDTARFCSNCATQLTSAQEAQPSFTKTLETPIDELKRGTLFADRYEIIEELGRGGMGKVYRALDTEVKEEVAVKLIRPEIAQDEATIERFRNELKVARKVSHRNICRMHDLGKAEEGYFITMEYVEGEDLKTLIRKKGKLSTDEAIEVVQQVCEGLAEAHDLGVIHRDLKPQNIMIDKKGKVKIMDFGIARSVEAPGITQTGVIIGTPDYISPEQAEGKEADERSDIYSLGVILYETVTGSVPFRGDTALSVAIKHKTQLPQDPRKLNPEVSDDLARLILICMEKDIKRRFQIAQDLLADLRNIEEGFPLGTKIRPRRQTLLSTLIRKKLLIPALVLALIIIAIAIWQLLPQKAPTPISSGVPSLAVLPFENISKNDDLDDILFALMINDLLQSQLINVLPDDRINGILHNLDLQDIDKFSSDDLVRIAGEGVVDYVARGSIIQAGENIILTLIVQRPADGKILGTRKFECQGENDLSAKVDEMTLEVKEALRFTQQQISGDIDELVGSITTSSPEAFKYYSEGRKYLHDFDMKKSIECMKKAIEIDPNFAMAYRSMANAYGTLRYGREYREALDKALELSEYVSLRERLLIQGDALLNPKEKIEAYQKVLELYSFDGLANAKLGELYRGREDFDKAIEYYEAAVRNNNIDSVLIGNLVAAYIYVSKYDEAEKLCLKHYDMLSKRQDHPIIYVYENQEKYDRALEEAKKLERSPPNSLMGRLLLLKGDFYEAEEKYREMLESKESATQYGGRRNLSYLYKAQGKFENAEEELRTALQIGEQYNQKEWVWSAFQDLIFLKLALGKAEEALKEWEKYEEAFPEIYTTWLLNLKVLILVMMKDFEEADKAARIFKENLDAFIEEYKTHKWVRHYSFFQGLKALEEDKLQESVLHLKDAVSLLSGGRDMFQHARFMEPLARAYYKAGDLDKARETYEKILHLTIGRYARGDIYARSFYMLGRIHEQQGDTAKAIEHYEKFLDLWKDADPGIVEVEDAKKRLKGIIQ